MLGDPRNVVFERIEPELLTADRYPVLVSEPADGPVVGHATHVHDRGMGEHLGAILKDARLRLRKSICGPEYSEGEQDGKDDEPRAPEVRPDLHPRDPPHAHERIRHHEGAPPR